AGEAAVRPSLTRRGDRADGVCHHARHTQGGPMTRIRRRLVALIAGLTVLGGVVAGPATAADSPIGRIGDTLRVEYDGLVVDVTVHAVRPSPVPPGFGYPPRPPRHEVWRADVTVHPIRVPMAHLLSTVFS